MPIQTMYPAKLGSPKTTLAASLSADATVMILTDASVLPAAPNIAVLGIDENCEIVSYSAIDYSTNAVSGLSRGLSGSVARVWESGSVVARNSTSLDHNRFKENIEALSNEKQNTLSWDTTPTSGSTNPVTSGGVKTALDAKQDTLNFDNVPTANSNNPVKSGGVYTALVQGFRDVYKVTLPSASESKKSFTAVGITANHVMVVEGFAYFSNSSVVTSKLSITTAANSITITGTLSGTTDIIVTLGIPRTITAS